MPVLQIVIASIRPGRLALPVAQWFAGCARQHAGFEPQLVDLAEVAFPLSDGSTTVHGANAVVFVMPENNYEVNAVPKSAIDTSVETTADVQTTRCLKREGGRIASGARISTSTNAVMAPIHSRLITPPTKSRSISAQQQPTQ